MRFILEIIPEGSSPVGREGMELSCGLWDVPAEHGSTGKHMAALRGSSLSDLGVRRYHGTDSYGRGACQELTEG